MRLEYILFISASEVLLKLSQENVGRGRRRPRVAFVPARVACGPYRAALSPGGKQTTPRRYPARDKLPTSTPDVANVLEEILTLLVGTRESTMKILRS